MQILAIVFFLMVSVSLALAAASAVLSAFFRVLSRYR